MLTANGLERDYQQKQNGKRQQEETIKGYFPGETAFRITLELLLEENLVKKILK